MIIGYLGPRGTHTQRAAERYAFAYTARHSGSRCDLVPEPSIPVLFKALHTRELDTILVPIENSHEGVVQVSMDLLVSSECYIQEEIVLPIRQDLFGKPGTTMSQITDVISHPQALAQCSLFLQTQFPSVRMHVADSTAAAAQRITEEVSPSWAAIGSAALTTLYPLLTLAESIQDSAHNQTRFVAVSRNIAPKTGHDKTSIVFSMTKDKPGGLYHVLEVFAERHINLTHIASRPCKTMLGEYLFFVDCEGHIEDPIVAKAIALIKTRCGFLKLLGSYRKDTAL